MSKPAKTFFYVQMITSVKPNEATKDALKTNKTKLSPYMYITINLKWHQNVT